jgi:signal transduction histidine kinase
MTRVILRDLAFDGRAFHTVHAASAAEAAQLLALTPEVQVLLLDVVMETPDAGLRLVEHIRGVMDNHHLRIVLRTGQPGDAPEREVMLGHDINDYTSKAELTAQRLFTTLVGALRAWRDIATIAQLNDDLRGLNESLEQRVVDRTRQLEETAEALARAKVRAETALMRETEAKRELRQFLSMVSHEFRTPLAIIDSSAQMLRLRAGEADPGRVGRLDTIREGVQRLLGLIDTCLADEQLDSGHLTLEEKTFDLARMIEAAINQHRTAAPDRFFIFPATPALMVWGDPSLISLVINNLLGNAVKYSPAGSVVRVDAGFDGADVSLSVTDQGIGIPDGETETIFERFHRASNARGIPGSGIGLHMVRQIVRMHGGAIRVDSRPGAGTCFTVRLRPPATGG